MKRFSLHAHPSLALWNARLFDKENPMTLLPLIVVCIAAPETAERDPHPARVSLPAAGL